jgi:hypothetical protein
MSIELGIGRKLSTAQVMPKVLLQATTVNALAISAMSGAGDGWVLRATFRIWLWHHVLAKKHS